MTKYVDVMYPDEEGDYPQKLATYLYNRFYKRYKGGKLLDIGCGTGAEMKAFERCGLDCYGVDIRKETNNPKIKECNLETNPFPFENNTFEGVFSKSVIEHLFRPDNLFKEAYRVLKPGGICIIMTPDWKSRMSHFWDDYTHVHPYTQRGLKDTLRIFEFQNVSCELIYQLPFTWKHPYLKFIPKIISIAPDSWRWKKNGTSRKIIRFSKGKMLLAHGWKVSQNTSRG
ncbi:hypothetical protein BEH94_06805 [Candidatus Altiarchaeales archaeon WOR_SM1_SCG]|nr:hypothetical protein BEH94_06805 [Candidatus Altiarchaeales archaeon WOR_SM1_SCG]